MVSPALAISLFVSLSYVAALHINFGGMNDHKTRRDDPKVIKFRMKRVLKMTLINLIVVPWLQMVYSQNGSTFRDAFLRLGLVPGLYYEQDAFHFAWRSFFESTAYCIKLICILYCGPLLDNILYYVLVPDVHLKRIFTDIYHELFTIWGVRNYIFAPVTEELFYTAMLINNYLITDSDLVTFKTMVFLPPLFFGIAHIHHGLEMHSVGIYSTGNIIISVLFQAIYTTIFGAFTNFVFIRTGGNLWCCVFLHAFANYMGFPGGSELNSQLSIVSHKCSRTLITFGGFWKWVYVGLLFVGVAGFKNNLWELTRSSFELKSY